MLVSSMFQSAVAGYFNRRPRDNPAVKQKHVELAMRGASALDEWRHENPAERLDLSNSDFSGATFSGWNLHRVNFDGARLERANFDGADLSQGSFRRAKLVAATFVKANLFRTPMNDADLRNADFTAAVLYRTNFTGCDLMGANFARSSRIKVIWPASGPPGQ
jgi:uncharacterized protein YjbI with pentapeptide repeats